MKASTAEIKAQIRELREAITYTRGDAEEYFVIAGNDWNDLSFVRACRQGDRLEAKLNKLEARLARAEEKAHTQIMKMRAKAMKPRRGIGSY